MLLLQLRKSLRYLIGNLDDFEPHDNVLSYSELQLVDQYTLHLLHKFISQVLNEAIFVLFFSFPVLTVTLGL